MPQHPSSHHHDLHLGDRTAEQAKQEKKKKNYCLLVPIVSCLYKPAMMSTVEYDAPASFIR